MFRDNITSDNVYTWREIGTTCGVQRLVFLTECFVRENHEEIQNTDASVALIKLLGELRVDTLPKNNVVLLVTDHESEDDWGKTLFIDTKKMVVETCYKDRDPLFQKLVFLCPPSLK